MLNLIGIVDGAQLLPKMQRQLDVLTTVDEETGQSLREWSQLMRRHAPLKFSNGYLRTREACLAIEDGVDVLENQIKNTMDPFGLHEEENDNVGGDDRATIDDIVLAVKSSNPELKFGYPNDFPSQLSALKETIFDVYKFHYRPFEWVYEGLGPLTLTDLLKKKRGTPAAIAMLITVVGQRLSIPLLPLPAAPIQAGAVNGFEEGMFGEALEELSPELATRVQSQTHGIPPGPGPWVVKLIRTSKESEEFDRHCSRSDRITNKENEEENEKLVLDAERGDLLTENDAMIRYPFLNDLNDATVCNESVLRTWQGLARIAIQAHQRRGEADFVAHWIYVAMALDPGAPEWSQVLS